MCKLPGSSLIFKQLPSAGGFDQDMQGLAKMSVAEEAFILNSCKDLSFFQSDLFVPLNSVLTFLVDRTPPLLFPGANRNCVTQHLVINILFLRWQFCSQWKHL